MQTLLISGKRKSEGGAPLRVLLLAFRRGGKVEVLVKLEVDWCKPPLVYYNHIRDHLLGKNVKRAVVPPRPPPILVPPFFQNLRELFKVFKSLKVV